MPPLPIHDVLPTLRSALAQRTAAVLQAPPGAGKTTVVPLALRDEPWLAGQQIVMLEPRRLATRAAARYMARSLGESPGQTVGFRVRGESRVSAATRVEVVTEGILTRRLASDPGLEGVGLVIFDEFHERSVQADLGLALTLQSQAVLREDLRILVMSATLDGETLAAMLGDAPVIRSEGRTFPVETRYLPRRPDTRLEQDVALAIRQALSESEGDVLVFLPGAREIRRVYDIVDTSGSALPTRVFPLYGALPTDEQDAAIAPSPLGQRKVVLATSIAQTSLTIEGVRVVIDAGLSRVPRFSPRTGMTRLETVRVSRASAEQRRGRAGRVAAGVCYRLWDAHEEHQLVPRDHPEILAADLAPVALELAVAGVGDPGELKWLDPPPAAALRQARELLVQLDALDQAGRLTQHGRQLAGLGTHPRLAHLMMRGAEAGATELATTVAALLEERDLLRGEGGPPPADFAVRVEAVAGRTAGVAATGARIDRGTLHHVKELAARWRGALQTENSTSATSNSSRKATGAARRRSANDGRVNTGSVLSIGALLALAYPDRVARRRDGQRTRYLMRNGQGVTLADAAAFPDAEWLVVAETDGRQPESRIYLAAPVEVAEVEAQFAEQFSVENEYSWNSAREVVVARRITRLGAIPWGESVIRDPETEAVTSVLLRELQRLGIAALPWNNSARLLRQRVAFLRTVDSAWPDWSDATLEATTEVWLAPLLVGARGMEDVRHANFGAALLGQLTWKQRAALDVQAPTHITVPTGSRIAIDYTDPTAPVLAVRLQELFGLADTPSIAGGRVPLVLHLLSPARRPVQVTQDLAGFWRSSYADVRKDMRGRYPRHYWPEDPLHAEPTRRAKPRGT